MELSQQTLLAPSCHCSALRQSCHGQNLGTSQCKHVILIRLGGNGRTIQLPSCHVCQSAERPATAHDRLSTKGRALTRQDSSTRRQWQTTPHAKVTSANLDVIAVQCIQTGKDMRTEFNCATNRSSRLSTAVLHLSFPNNAS